MTRPGPFPAVLTDPRGQLGMSDAEWESASLTGALSSGRLTAAPVG